MTGIDWDAVEVSDPFARRGNSYRRRGPDGPPYVLDPTGATTKAGKVRSLQYGRPSGFHEWIDNGYNLRRWSERMVLAGTCILVGSGELDIDGDLDDADRIVARAKHVAGADLSAERGTAAHEATHRLHDAERAEADVIEVLPELGFSDELVAAVLEAYCDALDRWGLEVVASEIKVVDDDWRLAGTADRFVRLRRDLRFGELVVPAGTVVVADLKTGALRVRAGEPLYWHGYAVQLASYAQGCAYVIDGDREWREPLPWPVDQTTGLILHIDIAGALDTDVVTVSLWSVDLELGRAAGQLAYLAREYAASSGIFGQLADGPVAQTVEVAGPSELEVLLAESLRVAAASRSPERPLTASEIRSRLRGWLQDRIDVIGAHTAARADLVRRWPPGVAVLSSSDAHSDAELAAIERAIDRVETDHSLPFPPPRPGMAETEPRGWLSQILHTFPGSTIESAGSINRNGQQP